MAIIYKITSPTDKIYIGSTINVKKRWNKYKNLNCKPQKRLYNSLLKYGSDSHIFEIIEECEESEMFKLELKYGILYEVLGENGLNCQLPKADDLIYSKTRAKEASCSPERREKARLSGLGRTHSQVSKDKISAAKKGIKRSDEFKEKMRQIALNRPPVSEETKNKISVSSSNRVHSEQTKVKMRKPKTEEWKEKNRKPKSNTVNYTGKNNHQSRSIINITNNTVYVSITDACNQLQKSVYDIKKIIKDENGFLKFYNNIN